MPKPDTLVSAPPALSRRRFTATLTASALGLGLAPGLVRAQAFPSRPLRVLVGFSAGSPSDLLARGLAEKLSTAFGQTAVVDNRPGAGGLLAVRTLLQAPPDGHTLLVVSAAHAATPVITRNLGFDPVKDLAGITRIANVPSILVVNPALGTATLADLLARLRAAPGTMNFSSPGQGSANHFAAEYFLAEAKASATHVPYRGVPEAVGAVVAGECQFSFVPAPNALSLIASGKLLALAACTGERATQLPDVPTIAQAGVPGYRFDPWFGVLTHGGVAPQVRQQLVEASVRGLAAPDLRARFEPIGAQISALPGERFDAYIQEEIAKFRYIAAMANIQAS